MNCEKCGKGTECFYFVMEESEKKKYCPACNSLYNTVSFNITNPYFSIEAQNQQEEQNYDRGKLDGWNEALEAVSKQTVTFMVSKQLTNHISEYVPEDLFVNDSDLDDILNSLKK